MPRFNLNDRIRYVSNDNVPLKTHVQGETWILELNEEFVIKGFQGERYVMDCVACTGGAMNKSIQAPTTIIDNACIRLVPPRDPLTSSYFPNLSHV